MIRCEYHCPRALGEALGLKAAVPGARVIAGGTDLMVRLRSRELAPAALISLRRIPELAGVREEQGGARIGAATTFTDLLDDPVVARDYPVLARAAARVGSRQIRNAGTVGGNLANASPCADSALPLLALGARVRLERSGGSRELPLDDFFLGPGATALAEDEILTAVILPPPDIGARALFLKKGRVKMDLAVASVAVLLSMDGPVCRKVRVAAGSVGPVPLRLREVEALLEGAAPTPERTARAAEVAMRCVAPITDVRSTADYRRHIVGVYLRRALESLLGREAA
ncbi:MAG: xanthine dehydrogenase family protein subunit M [Deltaproteobacteria bacterium]|nr:xanthine dehydrogenase family protein subunit M [Deltaproteobacteria bacterium]